MLSKHHSFSYFISKIKWIIYQKTIGKNKPWLTPDANQILSKFITKEKIGFEFGSGRSTIWFASKASRIISVEINEEWYTLVKNNIKDKSLLNIDYFLIPGSNKENPELSLYPKKILEYPDDFFDFVLVDSIHRLQCAKNALPKIKKGGLLIIDNMDDFLPSNTPTPLAISKHYLKRKDSTEWLRFYNDYLKVNKEIWTTNGVTDTAIFIIE